MSIPQMLRDLEQAVRSFPGRRPPRAADDPLAQALCDISRHYGIVRSPAALTAGLPLVDGRLPLEHAAPAAARARLEIKPATGGPAGLTPSDLPAILLMRDGSLNIAWSIDLDARQRPVALFLSEAGKPDERVRLELAEVLEAASGQALALCPRGGDDSRTSGLLGGTRRESWLLPILAGSSGIYLQAILATAAINVLALALPLFTMNVYDRVLPNLAEETMWALAIGVALAIAFDVAIKSLRGQVVEAAGRRADVLIGNLIYQRLIGGRLGGKMPSAGVRASTIREFETLREFLSSATLTAFGDMPFLLLYLAVIWAVAGGLVVVPLVAIPLVLGIGWLAQRMVARLMADSVREAALKNAVVVETLIGLESLKAAGGESWAASQWEAAVAEHVRTGNRIRLLTNSGIFLVHGAQTLTQVAMVVFGFYMVAAGDLTTGALIAATMLAGRAMQPLGQLAMLIGKLHQMRQSYRLLSEIVGAPQERPDGASFISKTSLDGRLAVEGATFQYDPSEPPVIEGLTFALKPGEHVGLVGGIGSGKSTVLKLVHALHVPQNGRVLVDGLPVDQIDPAILRSGIGLALQGGDLFHGTLRANITLGLPGADDEAVLEAAHTAGALDWIVQLPKGLDSQVQERGAGLSGGQRQSIVLARALVGRPRIVLLDEPTSHLDPQTERTVVERLGPWLKGRTALIVTHRPAMLGLVDRLIVLEKGRKRIDDRKPQALAALAAATREAKALGKGQAV